MVDSTFYFIGFLFWGNIYQIFQKGYGGIYFDNN